MVYDAVLLNGYLSRGFSCLKRGGKYIAYGVTDKAAPGTIRIPAIITAFLRLSIQQNVLSWVTGTEAEFYHVAGLRDAHPEYFASDLSVLMDLVAEGRLHPLVGKVWPFDEADKALTSIEAGTHIGKQIIRVAVP